MTFNPCIIIPVYNHETVLPETIESIQQYKLPILLVDDGSSLECKKVLVELSNKAHVFLTCNDSNLGKGGAVKTGLKAAQAQGFSHGLQIDADGQHNPKDIPRFVDYAKKNPTALIAGHPKYDTSVPKGRLYARYLTHVWVWINCLSKKVIDSMCGFRVYPLQQSIELIDSCYTGNRMDFDPEFIVRWYWQQRPLVQLQTAVIYPQHGTSHFRAWEDNKLISLMHTRLFFGMLLRSPKLIWRNISGINK
jgi:glycosyltransferase involved in cell wall biosynthesis